MQSPVALTPELKEIALGALDAYLDAGPFLPDGRTPIEMEVEGDRKRVETIKNKIKPLLTDYLARAVSLPEFKRQIDSINKQYPYWGFSGIKGQMFFNMLMRTSGESSECDTQIRSAIRQPASEEDAATLLRNFKAYVGRTGQQFVDGGGEHHSKPRQSSVPFFLSYFWQVQQREIWPVFYTNTVQMIGDLNLWQATGDIADDYLSYKLLHEQLAVIFSERSGRAFSLYDVEHVFWFKSGRMSTGASPTKENLASPQLASADQAPVAPTRKLVAEVQQAPSLPESYVPPIVAVIPTLARNDPDLQEACRRAGTSLPRAFEKCINAAFTILGYETLLLGQGTGRTPDGQAIAANEFYAILWDAKARLDRYSMGTDDRAIRQYIDNQSRLLKRSRAVRNIYYLIISSSFSDEFDELIRSLKMGTDVNEVCLIEAEALVAIVDQKMRAPLNVSLGSDGIQRLFSSSGIIKSNDVLENLD